MQDMLNRQKEFVKCLFDCIIANNSFLQYDKTTGLRNFLIYSGYHSLWNSEQIEEYCKFLKEIIPIDMFISYEDSFSSWIANEKSFEKSSILFVNYGNIISDYFFYDADKTLLYESHKHSGLNHIDDILYTYFQDNDSQFKRAYLEAYESCTQKGIDWPHHIKRYLRSECEDFYTHELSFLGLYLNNKRLGPRFSEHVFDCELSRDKLENEILSEYRKMLVNDLYEIKSKGLNPDYIMINGPSNSTYMIRNLTHDLLCKTFSKSNLNFCTNILADCVIRKAEYIYNRASSI